MPAHLVTIPFSHYCEKARWALDRRGIAFTEEAHLPMLHMRHTRALGGRSTPLLVVEDAAGRRVLPDSTDILRYADEAGTRGAPLYPGGDDRPARLEDRFDEVLGPHARRLGYIELFKDNALLREVVARSAVPAVERVLGVPTVPLFKIALTRSLKLDAGGQARSEARVREVFSEVEALLADGRRFLTGDAFTAADLTFAALAAPLVIPRAYQKHLLPLEDASASLRASVERWRATPAGAFAVRMFDTERFA